MGKKKETHQNRARARASDNLEKTLQPLASVTEVSAESVAAIQRAMVVSAVPSSFLPGRAVKVEETRNFSEQNGNLSFQASVFRARRPMTSSFAHVATDMMNAALNNGFTWSSMFDKESRASAEEWRVAYLVADKSVPDSLTTFLADVGPGAGLRHEARYSIAHIDSTTTPIAKVEELSLAVYGVPLSTLMAPALFLYNNSRLPANVLRSQLGLAVADEGDDNKETSSEEEIPTAAPVPPSAGKGQNLRKRARERVSGKAKGPDISDFLGKGNSKPKSASKPKSTAEESSSGDEPIRATVSQDTPPGHYGPHYGHGYPPPGAYMHPPHVPGGYYPAYAGGYGFNAPLPVYQQYPPPPPPPRTSRSKSGSKKGSKRGTSKDNGEDSA